MTDHNIYWTADDLVKRGLYPSREAVYADVRRGHIPARRLGHRRLRFIPAEVMGALRFVRDATVSAAQMPLIDPD